MGEPRPAYPPIHRRARSMRPPSATTAAVNTCAHVSVWMRVSCLLGTRLGVELLGHRDSPLNRLRLCLTAAAQAASPPAESKAPLSPPPPHTHCGLSFSSHIVGGCEVSLCFLLLATGPVKSGRRYCPTRGHRSITTVSPGGTQRRNAL